MIFTFLKYIKPTSYFTLKNKKGEYIYPSIDNIPLEILKKLTIDNNYVDNYSKKIDLSYQAVEKGYIGSAEKITQIENISIVDEYRFIRKYFSNFWGIHTLLLRLLSFKNPFKEITAFIKSLNTVKSNLSHVPIINHGWSSFKSELIKSKPKVSVIIPTLNRYIYLKDVLEDLEKQEYENFDVIIIDQSEPFQKEFYNAFNLDIKLIHQEEKALWLARNTAVKISDAALLLLFDDDSRVASDWITMHLKCLDFYNADISSGVSISVTGAKVPKNYSYFKYSDQLDTGNVLIKRAVFNSIGLFDRQFEKQRMGDGEYGLRAYLNGFINISNPSAKRLHLKVGTGGLRQMGSWDGFRPEKWFSPRPIPSVIYVFRKYYGKKLTIYNLIISIPSSLVPYKRKGNKKAILIAYLSLVFIWPLILFQVYKSWKLASIKLKEGAKIENISSLNTKI
jgi:glycosyltransferase involved in cell wall biosynthesis